MFQITEAVLIDYNAANPPFWWWNDPMTMEQLADVSNNCEVAAWLIESHLEYYDNDVELAVKAYHAGRGGVNGPAAETYWNKFRRAGDFFPEGG